MIRAQKKLALGSIGGSTRQGNSMSTCRKQRN
jgi:hypothetical protein